MGGGKKGEWGGGGGRIRGRCRYSQNVTEICILVFPLKVFNTCYSVSAGLGNF